MIENSGLGICGSKLSNLATKQISKQVNREGYEFQQINATKFELFMQQNI